MRKYICATAVLIIFQNIYAAPATIYRGVEQRAYPPPQVNHHPHPVFNHQAPQAQPAYPRNRYAYAHPYPPVIVNRPQIAIVTPHVGIYVEPEPTYHYQKTEEVYLPYGGTYRSVTEYTPQPTYPAKRRVIQSGRYDPYAQQ